MRDESFSIHQVEHIHDLYDDFIFNHFSVSYEFFINSFPSVSYEFFINSFPSVSYEFFINSINNARCHKKFNLLLLFYFLFYWF